MTPDTTTEPRYQVLVQTKDGSWKPHPKIPTIPLTLEQSQAWTRKVAKWQTIQRVQVS